MFNTNKATQMKSIEAKTPLTPLDREPRSHLNTDEAARHLNRQVQTLRIWACKDTGPIRPARINGRLAWPVQSLKTLLGVA
jgi:hypothetical protein